jgi:DNA-binding transcriptional regulator YiaG
MRLQLVVNYHQLKSHTKTKIENNFYYLLDPKYFVCNNRTITRTTCRKKGEHMFINIEIERVRRHMTKAEMSRRLGIDTFVLNDWIRKKRAIPASKLRALSLLFDGCSVDYLLKNPPGREGEGR